MNNQWAHALIELIAYFVVDVLWQASEKRESPEYIKAGRAKRLDVSLHHFVVCLGIFGAEDTGEFGNSNIWGPMDGRGLHPELSIHNGCHPQQAYIGCLPTLIS